MTTTHGKSATTRSPVWAIFLTACGILSAADDVSPGMRTQKDWPIYGGAGQTRYSALKQVNTGNVAKLKVAWTYDTDDGPNASQTHPIVVNGVLYGVTSKH